jgi:hypothetical protein
MAFWDRGNKKGPAGRPDLDDEAVSAFAGGNYRYFVFKWKFARGFSQWNWAAFFFGPLWFMLRRNYVWAGALSAALLAGDFYFSANPYRFTLTFELMLFSGLMANRVYYRQFRRLQDMLKRQKIPAARQGAQLARLGGRRWRPACALALGLAALTLLLPLFFGVNLYATRVRGLDAQSLLWSLAQPEQATEELAALRRDYQTARLRGEFARSLAVNESSLKLAALKLGRDHPYAIALQSDLIENKLNAGDFRAVLPLTEELIKQYQLQFGPEHMFMAFMMNNLVSNYLYQGLYDRAKSECFNALLILEKYSKNETHPVILANQAALTSNLGVIQQAYGQYDEAEKSDRDALQMSMQAEKGYSVYGVVYLERLGGLFLEQRRLEEAEEQFQQAKDIVGKSLGLGNPLASSLLLKLGEVRLWRMQLDAAERFFLQAQEINERCYGLRHAATAESAWDLSRVYLAEGKLHEAEKYANLCLKIAGNALGRENAHYARYLLQKAAVDLIRNDFGETEKALKTALKTYGNIFGESNLRLLEPLESLQALYAKTGNAVGQGVTAARIRRLKSAGEDEIPPAARRLSI